MASLPKVILLFVTDQFRNDAFDPAITPNLHNLASTSTTFLNSYVSAPTCTPARAGLLTGKSPWNHGLLGASLTVNCEEYPTTLPEILHGMGYKTSVVRKNHFGVNTTSGAFISQGYREMNSMMVRCGWLRKFPMIIISGSMTLCREWIRWLLVVIHSKMDFNGKLFVQVDYLYLLTYWTQIRSFFSFPGSNT
jgi:hypothetical protein